MLIEKTRTRTVCLIYQTQLQQRGLAIELGQSSCEGGESKVKLRAKMRLIPYQLALSCESRVSSGCDRILQYDSVFRFDGNG